MWLAAFNTLSQSVPMATDLRDPDHPPTVADGLNYEYYEGTWSELPDFTGLAAKKFGNVVNVDLAPRNRDTDYAFRFTGYIDVPTDGVYTFYTNSDDGSRLQIGSTIVVDNDGVHDAQDAAGTIGLKKGKHAITISYFQHLSAAVLITSYQGPGIPKQLIPATVLFRTGDPVAAWRLEAERAFLWGTVAADNSDGYTGSGFAEFQNSSDDYIKWVMAVPVYGVYQVTLRYALPTVPKNMTIEVNETMDSVLYFPSTPSWSDWSIITFTTWLNTGSNTIRLLASGQGGPHIDHLILGYRGVTSVVVGSDDDVVLNNPDANTLIPYPNPSPGKFYIDLPAQHAGLVEVDMISSNGSIIKSEKLGSAGQGTNTIMLDAENVGNGTYWVRVKHGAVSKAAAVVIQR
jgi:hypothetical protein